MLAAYLSLLVKARVRVEGEERVRIRKEREKSCRMGLVEEVDISIIYDI